MISRLTLLFGLFLFTSLAQAQQWYHVELVVFERFSGQYAEQWPEMTKVREGKLAPSMATTRIQPAQSFSLEGVASRLNNASDYRVLYHQAWQQPVLSKRSAKAVAIQSPDGLVDGVLRLFKLTYLNADIDLWLKENTAVINSFGDEALSSNEVVSNPHLQEIRRIKSKQRIYFDHPRIAAILELTPVETPAAAVSDTPETYSIQGADSANGQ